jgi:hypothetical protein
MKRQLLSVSVLMNVFIYVLNYKVITFSVGMI